MRIDKFLKISRLIKRRSVAKEVADKGRVQINGNLAKSSSNVQVGDIVKIQFGNRTIELKINALHESTKKEDAQEMYKIVSDERKN
ncbi:RNA-binding S4 domain-containing protein [Tetragenococcus halophilus]|uniref:RQC P-site tRNA stabilizing factor n=1 Tax=Tetragenococcus halophilus TaxID=51669 RepID=A0A3G5FFX4_TETHA|nr:RNA-binding S4 domain-containing protein [Tetragenococcus halophilus]AYW49219.1 RNA-binding S4 domain-containing protein [Tetragenococcus halophilus]MCO8291984.1 RNA-binding S4 domain-containing protein [Tetragenococcus halophilus]GBD62831.1 putative uncharacterized protein [Tetragenococcus halophilus subsp. flandriensis]